MPAIKLFGSWNFYENHAERYYMVVVLSGEQWLAVEKGWERVGQDNEVREYVYLPSRREGVKIKQTQKKFRFVFPTYGEYELYCALKEHELVEGVPAPSWAIACEI